MANAEQLALLRKCSKARDITEWNTWLKARLGKHSAYHEAFSRLLRDLQASTGVSG
ncbi:MAG: hypothetical protein WCF84_00085 [Anaerolineae bacterium]